MSVPIGMYWVHQKSSRQQAGKPRETWGFHGDFMGNFMVDFIGSQWGFPRGSDMILILQDKL